MKNIRKLITCLFTVCILFSIQLSVYAETTSESEAQLEITAGTGPTYPVDPEKPEDNLEEEPITGSLAIVSVSDFNFGTITAASATGLYDITTNQPNIQIVDLRGTGTGWSVSASVSAFTSGGTATLPGAVIHIYNGRPNSVAAPAYAPTQTTDAALTTDDTPVKLITAADGIGMGLWVMRWYPSAEETAAYIQLEVPPGAATVGTHTATINWTLSDTP